MAAQQNIPDWLIQDLGARGVPYIDNSDYAVPPESSWGCLFSEGRVKNGFHVEEIKDGVYWVSSGWYDMMFIVTGSGVIVFDAPIALGENILTAIESVTDEPVTHLVYSHWHSDHIGAATVFGDQVTIIAHDKTKELLTRFPDPFRPLPTDTFATDETLDVGGVKLELSYKGQNHCEGLIFGYAPAQKVLAAIDIASPGWVTFRDCDASENMSGYVEAHREILRYDFDTVVSGHVSRLGGKEDVREGLEYLEDLERFAKEALETVDLHYFANQLEGTKYHAAFRDAEENFFQACTNYGTKKMLEVETSNGKLWQERLNGVEAMTQHNMFQMIEKTRLEKSHGGYTLRGGKKPFETFYL